MSIKWDKRSKEDLRKRTGMQYAATKTQPKWRWRLHENKLYGIPEKEKGKQEIQVQYPVQEKTKSYVFKHEQWIFLDIASNKKLCMIFIASNLIYLFILLKHTILIVFGQWSFQVPILVPWIKASYFKILLSDATLSIASGGGILCQSIGSMSTQHPEESG